MHTTTDGNSSSSSFIRSNCHREALLPSSSKKATSSSPLSELSVDLWHAVADVSADHSSLCSQPAAFEDGQPLPACIFARLDAFWQWEACAAASSMPALGW
jgi:hypothetical protein